MSRTFIGFTFLVIAIAVSLASLRAEIGGFFMGSARRTYSGGTTISDVLPLTRNSTYSGETTIGAGTVQVGNVNYYWISQNTEGETLYCDFTPPSESASIWSIATNAGSTMINGSTQSLTGCNIYLGGATRNAGTLQVGNGNWNSATFRGTITDSSSIGLFPSFTPYGVSAGGLSDSEELTELMLDAMRLREQENKKAAAEAAGKSKPGQ